MSDNPGNMKKAVKDELELKHFGYCAHTLNLIAQGDVQTINSL